MSREARTDLLLEEERTCPECKSSHVVIDEARGERVCEACGLVLEDRAIDSHPDWSAYDSAEAERRAHAGAPRDPLAGATGLTTVIPAPHRDAHGNVIPSEGRGALYRMQKLQRHSSHAFPGERSLPSALRTLERVVSLLDLPKTVRDEAGFLCRKAIQRRLAQGRSIDVLVAAAVYAACRIDGVPRTLDELHQVTGLRKTAVGAAYRALHRELSIAVHASRPADFVQRFCSELGLSNRVEREALTLLERFEPPGTATSVSPCGTAGAAIYLASLVCAEPRSERAIARVAGVSEVTLRNRFLEMKPLVPEIQTPRGRTKKPTAPRP